MCLYCARLLAVSSQRACSVPVMRLWWVLEYSGAEGLFSNPGQRSDPEVRGESMVRGNTSIEKAGTSRR